MYYYKVLVNNLDMKKIIFVIVYVISFCAVFFILLFDIFFVKYENVIINKGNKYEIDKNLIASIIYVESKFNKNAKSNKGAVGLMQLMPQTAKSFYVGDEFSEDILFKPEVNIEIGVKYLKYLFDKYQDEVTVLACYNAGEKVVLEWKGESKYLEKTQIGYKETLNYVKKVQKIKKYCKIFVL